MVMLSESIPREKREAAIPVITKSKYYSKNTQLNNISCVSIEGNSAQHKRTALCIDAPKCLKINTRSFEYAHLLLGRMAGGEHIIPGGCLPGHSRYRDDVVTAMRVLCWKFPSMVRMVLRGDGFHIVVCTTAVIKNCITVGDA
jgi:hypothetical protein